MSDMTDTVIRDADGQVVAQWREGHSAESQDFYVITQICATQPAPLNNGLDLSKMGL